MKKYFIVIFLFLFPIKIDALPISYDLRDWGRVSSVKNQGIPGPCWAFAAIGALESNYLTQKLNVDGKIPDLSEMQLAFFCYKDPKPERNFTSEHKSGTLSLEGNVFMSVAFLSRLSGPTDERFLPYNTNLTYNEKNSLMKKSPEDFKRSMRLREAFYMSGDSALSRENIKELIMQYGLLVVSMYSDLHKYHTKGGYYTYYNPGKGTKINHLVTIAGWDDNFSNENFTPKPKKNGAWLVKNSWGTMRGSNAGYFMMSYEQHIYGGTAFIAEKYNKQLKHYGYDDLGWCANANFYWAANIFQINGKKERLKEVAFYTSRNNVDYELFIYELGNISKNNPIAGNLIAKQKGHIRYAGYHTVNLLDLITLNKGNYFSVVVKFSNKNMPVETKIKKYSDNAVVNEHESFFSNDGKNWTDGVKINSNACIKAFTIIQV